MEPPQLPRGSARAKRILLLAIPVVLALAAVLAVVVSAHRVLNRVAQRAGEDQLAFTLRPVDQSSNQAHNLGFEPVASGPRYTSGAFFAGDLYLAGFSGLTAIRADGNSRFHLRTGFELPVAPVVSVMSARLRGSSEPQLLLATAGAGLLLLQPNAQASPMIRQLLPADSGDRDLTALLPLATGDLLLGTRDHGVLLYNGAALTRLRFTLPGIRPEALPVTALAAVDSASFLIGTRNSGVFYVHGGTVDHVDASSGLPDNQVESLAVSSNSGSAHAFAGTPVGIAEFNLAESNFRPVRILAQGAFSHALAVGEGQVTVGTIDQGIQRIPLDDHPRLRPASISVGPETESSQRSQRIDAFISAPGELYALADGKLLRGNGSGWTPALAPVSAALTDANISALAFAPDGTLYVGLFDHGMDLLSPEGSVRHLEDDHLFCINRLALDPERHTIAAATANGLVLFDARGIPRQTLTRRDGLISDHVTDIAFTRTGTALATPAGITFLGPSGAESLYAFQGLANNHVYALAQGSGSGQLLAGTLGGISILQANTVERNLTVSNSTLKHNWITALLPMANSSTLVGTYGRGLEILDRQGRFTTVELPAGTPGDLVINPNALFQTATHIYAGTLDHGLLVYSIASGRWSAMTGGLPSLNVTAFAYRAGELYLGTENGLVRLSEANIP